MRLRRSDLAVLVLLLFLGVAYLGVHYVVSDLWARPKPIRPPAGLTAVAKPDGGNAGFTKVFSGDPAEEKEWLTPDGRSIVVDGKGRRVGTMTPCGFVPDEYGQEGPCDVVPTTFVGDPP